MAIVTIDAFKLYVENQRTGADNTARLQSALDAAHVAVYSYLGRSCEVASGSSARVYAPDGDEVLQIHDCTTITSVVENGVTLTAGTQYQPEPLNGVTFAGLPWPYEQLRRLNSFIWYTDPSTYGKATVTVTATWGWSAAPAPAVEAVKIVGKDIALARELKGDVAGFAEFGAVRIRQNAQVVAMLEDYRRLPIATVI